MDQSRTTLTWLAFSTLGAFGTFAAVNEADALVNSDTKKAANQAGATSVAELSFSSESAELSEGAKKDLQEILAVAAKKGAIQSIRVAAWADQEYPSQGTDLAPTQIDLAEKRAEGVQAYLEKTLKGVKISTVNMAERPSGIQNALKTKGAQTKNILESSGAAPTTSAQTGFLGLKGKASRAVVLVYTK